MSAKKLLIIVFSVIITASFIYAEQGTTAAVFLKLEQGVRPISMGAAFTGLADDVNAIQYNPAGLTQLPGFEISFMHSVWFQGIFYDNLALAYPFGDAGTFGLSVVYVNSGTIKGWDEFGVATSDFSASDIGVNLGYGTQLSKELSLGVTMKMFSEMIATENAFGFAGDLAVLYKLPVTGLQAGFMVQNLGPKFGFGEAFMLPITFRLGVAYKGVKNLAVTMDYSQAIETNGILAMGMEYWYKNLVVLRLGYQYQGMFDKNYYYQNYAGPAILAGFVVGGGLKLDMYEIDYAYKQYGVLGSTHRVGLTVSVK
ncbi:MAG: PorV/PorQ family protein [bacterium]